MLSSCQGSAQLSSQLCSQLLHEFLHDACYLFVVECLAVILQDEVDGVGFLALRQILAFVHIEEIHGTEQLLLCLISNLFYLGKLHILVHQQGEVSAY